MRDARALIAGQLPLASFQLWQYNTAKVVVILSAHPSGFKTIRQAAEAWGASVRRVNQWVSGGRVPGAVRAGNAWLIPDRAERPVDLRRGKRASRAASLTADLLQIAAATSLPMPDDCPDAILDIAGEARPRLVYESALCYLRGDFARTVTCFQMADGDDALQLRMCLLAIAAAMCTGDYALYQRIESWLKDIIHDQISPQVTAIAQMGLNTAYVSAIAPQMASDWLKAGDFGALPLSIRIDACFHRAKYFQGLGKYESMLAVSETALALCDAEPDIHYSAIYLRHMCASACYALGRQGEATQWLRESMRRALPHGFITPFAEAATADGGLVEQLLEREFPACYAPVTALWKRSIPNWLSFHNRFTKDNITGILSLREYQIARLAADGVPYREIARRFHISEGHLKNLMQKLCEKLLISGKSRRQALSKYVL